MEISDAKVVESNALKDLVEETYGRAFRIFREENGEPAFTYSSVQVPEFTPDQIAGVSEDDPEECRELRDWLASEKKDYDSEWPAPLSAIIADLHHRDLIPAGDYLIHYWW